MIIAPINLQDWIDDNRELLKPPVCNKVAYEDTEFIIMVVGGPNTRKDYHIDEGEEFFYQIEGNMILRIMENNVPKDIKIHEGEIFLLPPKIPHSPQRFKDTVGLVIERKRRKSELDGFQWYCDSCNVLLYEKFFFLTDIVKELPPLFDAFWNNIESRACSNCGEVLEKELNA